MTRRDFIAIAKALAYSRPTGPEALSQWTKDRAAIVRVLAASNDLFEHDRFIRATEKEPE